MPNLTLKNVPQALYERLKANAKRNRRSLNSEILVTLEGSLFATRIDPAEYLARIDAIRSRMKGELTEDILEEALESGRR